MPTFYPAPSVNYFSTTLNGAINDSVQTITLNSVTGLSTSGGVLVINREDSSGTPTPNAREIISYTGIAGSDLTGVVRAFDSSTNRSHANNSLVEAVFTVGMWNDLRNAVNTAMLTSGTGVNVSTATVTTLLTSPAALVSTLTVGGLSTAHRLSITSTVSASRGEFSGLQAASVASIALPNSAVTNVQRRAIFSRVVASAQITLSAEYKDLVTTSIAAANNPQQSVIKVSGAASVWGTATGRGSIGVRVGGADHAAYDAVNEIALAGFNNTETQTVSAKSLNGFIYVSAPSGNATITLVGRSQDSGFHNVTSRYIQVESIGG